MKGLIDLLFYLLMCLLIGVSFYIVTSFVCNLTSWADENTASATLRLCLFILILLYLHISNYSHIDLFINFKLHKNLLSLQRLEINLRNLDLPVFL